MTCREFAEFLDAYIAGELPAEEVAEFRRHLAVCAHCVAYLATYRATVDICQRLRAQAGPVPGDVPEQLVQAILQSRNKA